MNDLKAVESSWRLDYRRRVIARHGDRPHPFQPAQPFGKGAEVCAECGGHFIYCAHDPALREDAR